MPRPRMFFGGQIGPAQRREARSLCKLLLKQWWTDWKVRGAHLYNDFAPIEPRVLLDLLHDIAHGRGYDRSPLALILNRKAYHLRKRHAVWCLASNLVTLPPTTNTQKGE